MNVKDFTKDFEAPKTLTVADLDVFPLDLEVFTDGKGQNSNKEEYSYNYVNVNGKEYRLPNPVAEKIREMLKIKSTIEKVSINSTGSGTSTKYTVDEL